MPSPRPAKFQRGQWSLIGILVSLAIIAILSAWYYNSILKPKAGSHNGRPASEQAAYGAGCSLYVSQLNQASMMYKQDHNDRSPQSFEDLKKEGATDDILHAEGCQFQLDASTGAVTDVGRGEAARNAPNSVVNVPSGGGAAPGYAPSVAPAPGGRAVGPGGVTLPPGGAGGSVPASGDLGTE